MKPGKNSQLIPVIIIVLIVVVSVAAIVAFVRTIAGGDGASTEDNEITQEERALLSSTADRGVRMTVRGEITADETHRSYRVEITPSSRTMTTYKGYLDQLHDTVQISNNVAAYEEFVYALGRAGMDEGEAFTGVDDDTRGLCANGKILEFELLQNGQSTKRLWTTTCSGIDGSFTANDGVISDMFINQIPDSQALISDINKS